MVVGHHSTSESLPNESRVAVIKNWGPCKDLSEVHAFLGTVGVTRIFIRNFAHSFRVQRRTDQGPRGSQASTSQVPRT